VLETHHEASRVLDQEGEIMIYSDSAEATARYGQYVAEVQQLVEDQLEVLFTIVTAGAAQASTGDQQIAVTRQARTLTASTVLRTVVFRIEAITDRPTDLRLAARFRTGQARCILPTVDGSGAMAAWELMLQGAGVRGARAEYTWMDAGTQKTLTAAAVAATLRSFFP
jgi:hypothetical protein